MRTACGGLAGLVLAGVLAPLGAARAAAPQDGASAPLLITTDTVLQSGRHYGPIVIAASGITLDGNGAVIDGALLRGDGTAGPDGEQGRAPDAAAGLVAPPPRDFTGVGVDAQGVSGVTIRNLTVRGFRIGLRVRDASDWTITGSDFSDNFHDPDFGWGEQDPGGGIALTDVRRFTLRDLVARNNWDACSLVRCDDSLIEHVDFSHASNTCLKLWNASRNVVRDSNLSLGLRIAPGETHARDSTCVLIESGSDDNRLQRNDATHGGDGIFIRVLNGWTSRRNVFEHNDVSYANNNGFEAWSPENSFLRNVANHCSYGFWLGASDRTTLIDNEAGWNGLPDGFHNAPEDFGHGGIVFVNGPSSHTVAVGNHCHDNAGGGIVLRGDVATQGAAWKAFHWVIEDNQLERNRWGLFVQFADWIDLRMNRFADNAEGDVHDGGGVTHLVRHDREQRVCFGRTLTLDGPTGAVRVGRPVTLTATATIDGAGDSGDSGVSGDSGDSGDSGISGDSSGLGGSGNPSPFSFRWDLGDGTVATGARVEHAWARPGLQRVGLTAEDGSISSLASLDVFVVEDAPELDTQGAAAWRLADESGAGRAVFTDDPHALVGASCVLAHLEPYDGGRAALLYPASRTLCRPLGTPPGGVAILGAWLKVRNPGIPAWQGANPVITLFESDTRWRRLVPDRDLLGSPSMLESRDDWNLVEVPLAGDAHWSAEDGPDGAPATLNWLTIGVDSWGWPPLDIRVDGLVLR